MTISFWKCGCHHRVGIKYKDFTCEWCHMRIRLGGYSLAQLVWFQMNYVSWKIVRMLKSKLWQQ